MYFRSEATAKKTVENAASDGFGSNSSAAAFCLPTNWWASCFANISPTDGYLLAKFYTLSIQPSQQKLQNFIGIWLKVKKVTPF